MLSFDVWIKAGSVQSGMVWYGMAGQGRAQRGTDNNVRHSLDRSTPFPMALSHSYSSSI